MRVMTFVGTRPEIIKLSRVLPALDQHFEHALVHTGQNWSPQLNEDIFKDLRLREPDLKQDPLRSDVYTPVQVVTRVASYADQILRLYKPDAVLALGDTNSAVGAAYAAKRNKIPLFHMEAGNRCFDDRTPEEINRRIVDTIADVNLPYTEHARRNLLGMGCPEDRIVKTGSPMCEVLNYYKEDIARSFVCFDAPHTYYVVSAHREENVDDPERVKALVGTINKLASFGQVYVSVHPRTRPKLDQFIFLEGVYLNEPFGFLHYARLQQDACCVISDSGTLAEEAAILGFPAVSIRYGTERPEAMEEGSFVLSDLNPQAVLRAVTLAQAYGRIHHKLPFDYQPDQVAMKVAHTIMSMTDKVRRDTWRQ
jgi:UDP-N-acetyl-L-fucosamine synthase